MSVKLTCRKLIGICLASCAPSCGTYIGPNLMVPLAGEKALVGASAGYGFDLAGSRGPVLGAGVSAAPQEGDDRKSRGWVSVTAGYGQQPVPHQPRVGFEAKAGPAAGILPDRGGYPFSIGWTLELDLLYRLSRTVRPWELGDHALTYPVLFPSLQVAQLVPLGEGHDHGVATTFVFGVSYRTDSWLAVEP